MHATDIEIEFILGITSRKFGSQYVAEFGSDMGLSIQGFGETPNEARYSLLLRVIQRAPRYMERVRKHLAGDPEALDVAVDFEPFEDGSTLIHIKDAAGRKRVVEGPRTRR